MPILFTLISLVVGGVIAWTIRQFLLAIGATRGAEANITAESGRIIRIIIGILLIIAGFFWYNSLWFLIAGLFLYGGIWRWSIMRAFSE